MKRKNLYIVNFIMILSIFIMSCKSAPEHTVSIDKNFEPTGRIVIPFTYNREGYMPVFTMKDTEGLEIKLAFDSGFNHCVMLKKGLLKTGLSEEDLVNSTFESLKEQYPTAKESVLRKSAKQKVLIGGSCFSANGFANGNLKIDGCLFQYEPTIKIKDNIDCIVGLQFFGNCDNIVIDYLHQVIEVDTKLLNGTVVLMKKIPEFDLYETQILINGIKQSAIIDTGSEKFVARKNYNKKNSELSDTEKLNYMQNYHGRPRSFPWFRIVSVSFGAIKKNLVAYKSTNILMHCTNDTRKLGCVYNFLGYPFFCDTRIQFDFKNSQFIIE